MTRVTPTLTRRRLLTLLGGTVGATVLGPLDPLTALTAASASTTRPIVHGVATANLDTLRAFELDAGRFAQAYTYYRSWGGTVNLTWEADYARRLLARGTTPVLTFQPQTPGLGVDQPAYAHDRIVAGDFDGLLQRWAACLRSAGGTVRVRLMHEGNGSWYPWCALANGNTAESYVQAFRHVRGVFDDEGATNVRWQWSMNKLAPHQAPIEALYPGDDVVDEIGFSGYNGGTIVDRGGWRSFGETFAESVEAAQRIADKPVFVAETSSASGSTGDRAAWITDMWAWLAENPQVAGVTWFDFDKGSVDWRLDTSAEAVAAYRKGALAVVPPRS